MLNVVDAGKKQGYLWPALGDGRCIEPRPRTRFWSKCGTVTIADLGDFDMREEIARRMTTHQLHYYPHVRTGDGRGHAMVQAELRRREAWTARIALMIAFASLIVSVLSAVLQ